MSRILNIFAPAKINLFLHITGRRDDGYHFLNSLTGFADIGDEIRIEEAQDFTFEVTGPYAGNFGPKEIDASPSSSNLAVRAAWLTAREVKKTLAVKITLTKNLPLAAGIGGGSADAAAVIWGLLEWWGLPKSPEIAQTFMADLGADLPVCFSCQSAMVSGVGEGLTAVDLPEIPIALINPGKACPTKDVFLRYSGDFAEEIAELPSLNTIHALFDYLSKTRNDLQDPARESIPEITNVLNALNAEQGCRLARLSGSGATCFGLFETAKAAEAAAASILEENPDWWVKSGTLNRPERY